MIYHFKIGIMESRELLTYILGYLNGLNTMTKVSSNKIHKLKELIENNRTQKHNEVENENDYSEEYDDSDNDTYSLYDNPHYNDEVDLDQQGPDFDF